MEILTFCQNRRRCQEAPPPPSWGTWRPTPSTMWLLFPSTQMWRASGRPRRERQVSDSRGRLRSTHSALEFTFLWACVCIVPESQIISLKIPFMLCVGLFVSGGSLADRNKTGMSTDFLCSDGSGTNLLCKILFKIYDISQKFTATYSIKYNFKGSYRF